MEAKAFFEKTVLVGQFFVGVSLLIGLSRLKKLNGDQRVLLTLVAIATTIEISSRILWIYSLNNLFLYHFYCIVEFLLLASLYTKYLNGLMKPIYMRGLMVAFVLFALGNTLFFQSLKQFNSHVIFTECLLLIVLSILFFYKELRDLEYRHWERVPMFWINSSVITYFSGALVLFYVANNLIPESLKVRGVVWGVHALFNCVHYALYAMALWVKTDRN